MDGARAQRVRLPRLRAGGRPRAALLALRQAGGVVRRPPLVGELQVVFLAEPESARGVDGAMGLLAAAQDAKALPAGHAIEDAVDRLVFGGSSDNYFELRVRRDAKERRLSHRYSRDIRAALEALVWFGGRASDFYQFTYMDREWRCVLEGECGDDPDGYQCEGRGDTLALAICRAMLDVREGT